MAALGVLYLVFEDFVLNDFSSAGNKQTKRLGPERLLVGVQVSLAPLI